MRYVSDEAALIAWSAVAEPGDVDAGALVQAVGASAALSWVHLGEANLTRAGIDLAERSGPELATRALRAHERWARRLDLARSPHADRARAVQARVVTRGSDDWPTCLDSLGEAAPFALYVRGALGGHGSGLSSWWGSGVAVVGARSATSYGLHVAHEIAGDLAALGRAVVSGGAYGIDGAAHRGALGRDAPTVAVMAGGVDRLYPAGHEELLTAVMGAGAVISEVPPGFAPHRQRFLARNRLIAAAAVTVVVEAAHRSGALSTANHAAALLRPVGAVPGPVTSASSAGCHALIRDRIAELVTGADQVLELAALAGEATVADARESGGQARGPGSVGALDFDAPSHRAIYGAAVRRAQTIESLAAQAGLGLADARAALGALEARGLVVRKGGMWSRSTP